MESESNRLESTLRSAEPGALATWSRTWPAEGAPEQRSMKSSETGWLDFEYDRTSV